MNAAGQTLCLNMIVRNEAAVIRRCLDSVRPIIDRWVIVDTGSTDGTQDIIRQHLRDMPGELHARPWRDFAHNRSEALDLARGQSDFTLIIDADDTLAIAPDASLPALTDDSYSVEFDDAGTVYRRTQLVRSALPWRYEGVLHEYLTCDEAGAAGHLIDIRMQRNHDGARRKDPDTYKRDAAVLEAALQTETNDFLRARYRFYLAQSYWDCSEHELSLQNYLARAELGLWQEEVFISLYRAAQIKEMLGHPEQSVIDAFLRASDAEPTRAEALHGASHFCRLRDRFEESYQIAKRGLAIPMPVDGLFVEPWIYETGLLDEFSVSAYWSGRPWDCLDASLKILAAGKLSGADMQRIVVNARFAAETFPRDVPPPSPRADQKTIGLCMIVKNEARVIVRCLESAAPLLDYVLIEDTGSTDGTQAIVREWLDRKGLRGEVIEEPWRDFAYNRSHALARLRENTSIDYALVLDADDSLVIEAGFDVAAFKAGLTRDVYKVALRHGGVHYRRDQICSNRRAFHYRGVLHEFLQGPPEGVSSGVATGLHILTSREGARSQDPEKYYKDAETLEQALRTEQDPFLRSRYTFYLAQSYRDAGEREKAVAAYLRRAELGYWVDEVFMSLYGAAKLQDAMGRPFDEVMTLFQRASDAAPARAEALHAASRLCRRHKKFAEAYELASRGLRITLPSGGLFVEAWTYEYGLLDELAVSAYWSERYQECLSACRRLLAEGKMPQTMHDRVKRNAELAEAKLQASEALAPAAAESDWTPPAAAGGTELMIEGLRARIPDALARIHLHENVLPASLPDDRPLVMWMHHDANQNAVQWCRDRALVDRVACFVFVSHWQRERFQSAFAIPPGKCVVLRNATKVAPERRVWTDTRPLRFAYTSTPFRGLSVLLAAWERLRLRDAELHIWSSMRLYREDDAEFAPLFDRARSLSGVIYHGIVPNQELKSALRGIHFLAYPSTFEETSCLAVIDAMAEGCRVIVPALGALPETTCGFAHIYPWSADPAEHTNLFAAAMAEEVASPWGRAPEMALTQQTHCALFFDWQERVREWVRLIDRLDAAQRAEGWRGDLARARYERAAGG
jgi:glycosyltransferase involved in cell wall biosynthesis